MPERPKQQNKPQPSLLVLGGIAEARYLTEKLVDLCQEEQLGQCFYSLAGLSDKPSLPKQAECITGGFGGQDGLERFFDKKNIAAVIDATHPFTRKIGQNTQKACKNKNIAFLRFLRPLWRLKNRDLFHQTDDIKQTLPCLNAGFSRVFLALGSRDFSFFSNHHDIFFLLRTISPLSTPPPFKNFLAIHGKGPFSVAREYDLLKQHKIQAIIARNSGGQGSFAKLVAAKKLNLPVFLIRPVLPENQNICHRIDDAVIWSKKQLTQHKISEWRTGIKNFTKKL